MSYRLLIVDDEEDIREGLAELVDWESLGFTVAARLVDGRDAISYMQSDRVDVILTDIKMTFVSGLELAKYVYDGGHDTKMILLSGYKEFEFAQQAVHYQVVHYLLKPTRLPELVRVFKEVKLQLDKEKNEKEQMLSIQSQNEEMLSLLRRQFFAELLAGTLKERQEIDRRLPFIDLPLDPDSSPCCSFCIQLPRSKELAPEHPEQANSQFFRLIAQIYEKEQNPVHTIPVSVEDDMIVLAAVDCRASHSPDWTLKEAVHLQFETVKGRIRAIWGIEARLTRLTLAPSIMTMIAKQAREDSRQPASSEGDTPDTLVIQKAKAYIQNMYDKDILLEDVAEHVYLSPVYFSRLFKKQTGRNFTEYLTEVRLMKAMEYLRQPQYKVYEIGAMIGYKSTKYFFKLFKQYAGCTPSEYRNKLHDASGR